MTVHLAQIVLLFLVVSDELIRVHASCKTSWISFHSYAFSGQLFVWKAQAERPTTQSFALLPSRNSFVERYSSTGISESSESDPFTFTGRGRLVAHCSEILNASRASFRNRLAGYDCECPPPSDPSKKNRPVCGEWQFGKRAFQLPVVPPLCSNTCADVCPHCPSSDCVPLECREMEAEEGSDAKLCNFYVEGSIPTTRPNPINDCKCPVRDGMIQRIGSAVEGNGRTIGWNKFAYAQLGSLKASLGVTARTPPMMKCVKTDIHATFLCRVLFQFFAWFGNVKSAIAQSLNIVQTDGIGTNTVKGVDGQLITARHTLKETVKTLSVIGCVFAFMSTIVNLLKVLNSFICTNAKCTGITSLVLVGFGIVSILMFFNPLGLVTGMAWVGLALTVAAFIIRLKGEGICNGLADYFKNSMDDVDTNSKAWEAAKEDVATALALSPPSDEPGLRRAEISAIAQGIGLDFNEYRSGLPTPQQCQETLGQEAPDALQAAWRDSQSVTAESAQAEFFDKNRDAEGMVEECESGGPGCPEYSSGDIVLD